MAAKRKKWRATPNGGPVAHKQFGSQAAAYRYVNAQRDEYRRGDTSITRITVWVDEGSGWKRYEELNFAEEGR